MLLQRCEGGVDAALQYAKNISKYMKDLMGYLEKRTTLGEAGRVRVRQHQTRSRSFMGSDAARASRMSPHFQPSSSRDGVCQRVSEDGQ